MVSPARLYIPASALALAGMAWRMGWFDWVGPELLIIPVLLVMAILCILVVLCILVAGGLAVLAIFVISSPFIWLFDRAFGRTSTPPPLPPSPARAEEARPPSNTAMG